VKIVVIPTIQAVTRGIHLDVLPIAAPDVRDCLRFAYPIVQVATDRYLRLHCSTNGHYLQDLNAIGGGLVVRTNLYQFLYYAQLMSEAETTGMSNSDQAGLPDQELSARVVQVGFFDVVAILRRHKWSFLALTAVIIYAINMVALILEPDGPQYHAEALVVATELELRVESFPRTAVAIFNGGTVASLAAERSGTGISPDVLIPEIVNVEPVENTAVLEIDAIHGDPELAALYANVVGQALAEELNRVGPGLGTFALQIEAVVPTAPLERSRIITIILSVVAAGLSTVGVAGLITFVSQSRSRTEALAVSVAPKKPDARVDSIGAQSRVVEVAISTVAEAGEVPPSPSESMADATREANAELEAQRAEAERAERRRGPLPHMISSPDEAGEIVAAISGIGPAFGARLATAGIKTVPELAASNPRWLAEAIDVRRNVAADWIDQASRLTESTIEMSEEPRPVPESPSS